MTLVLGEADVEALLDMKEVVASVEDAFGHLGQGDGDNSPRTRSRSPGGVLNVLHATLPHLGRGGLKCYLSSRTGTRFVFLLFDLADSTLLAVMGADALGRYRTGAASGVATKHLYGKGTARLAVCGAGKQAMTQVLGVASATHIAEVRAWSRDQGHRDAFVGRLESAGFRAAPADTPEAALEGADVCVTITSARAPFLRLSSVENLRHLNLCGSNQPDRAEAAADVFGRFRAPVVDDLRQARSEYGDLIGAERVGTFTWETALELKDIVSGKAKVEPPTVFKSGGVAIEDVAAGSLVYDKALESGRFEDSTVRLF